MAEILNLWPIFGALACIVWLYLDDLRDSDEFAARMVLGAEPGSETRRCLRAAARHGRRIDRRRRWALRVRRLTR